MSKTLLIIIFLIVILTGGLIILFPKHIQQDQSISVSPTKLKSMDDFKTIRQPAVAGQFYPEDKDELSQMIDQFLNNVELESTDLTPRVLILPHAGYVFSGQTAAYGFKALQGKNYDNVIILGSSHNFPTNDLVLYGGDAISTPLGLVPTNQKIISQLAKESEIKIQDDIHLPEHSLEVQLPFLQKVLSSDWQVVLGLINTDNYEDLQNIANDIYTLVTQYPNTLVVISSDLSHYPKYKDAIDSDQRILEAILTKEPSIFSATNLQILAEEKPGLDTCACGASAIKIGMFLADKMNLQGKILNYSNSGDIKDYGDKHRVVGYGAVAFNQSDNQASQYLNDQEQQAALKLARNTLELEFKLTQEKYEDYVKHPIFKEKRGVFVTLNINHQLRGCIGLIEPVKPLAKGIIEMAKAAAFNDQRFEPLTKEEFKNVKIEVSVLTPPRKINDPHKEIQLGKHGVIVKQGTNSGVYLPQVATDTGWDLETFMVSLCASKANLPETCWQDGSADIYTFEAQIFEE
jgi:AmmeMemoRadiSam system protein B/AmmeMemoRadiSam system protein A